MKVIAITGSIGCGKTTLGHIVRQLGYTVFDVDGWVRKLYYQKKFIKVLAKYFPEVVDEGQAAVNKRQLRNIVFSDRKRLKVLEGLIHPFLRQTFKNTIRRNAQYDDLFFVDVALLFEMGWEAYCDFIIVADVDYALQKQRVMARDHVSAEDFDKINNVQLSNDHKKKLADMVVNTDKAFNLLKVELINIIQGLEAADD